MTLQIGILGARGIGKVHARIFHLLGTEVRAVLGSSPETARKAAEDLEASVGCKPKPFSDLASFLNEPLDAVSICTPPNQHFSQIMAAFDKGIAVFCEKPLFWDESLLQNEVSDRLRQLRLHPSRRLFMNAPSAFFLADINKWLKPKQEIQVLKFNFHTRGKFRYMDIASDLFTHGMSIVLKTLGSNIVTNFSSAVRDDHYNCTFHYGNCNVEFDFHEDVSGDKLFALEVDGRMFTRIQEGEGNSYRIFIHDSLTSDKVEITDPFNQSIQSFISYCGKQAPAGQDKFEEAELITHIMAQNLLSTKDQN